MRTLPVVEYVLLNYRSARDSDIDLIIRVWQQEGLKLTYQQTELLKDKCSKPETIRRLRQKLQEQGEYKASEKVDEARFTKSVETRQSIGVTSPKETEEVLNHAVNVRLEY